MDVLGDRIVGIAAASLVCAAAQAVAPEGRGRRMVRLAGGACLLLAIFLPLRGLDTSRFSLENYQFSEEYTAASEEIARTNYQLEKTIIEQKLASYIQSKADALGLVLDATVLCEEVDGFPLPQSVVLRVSGDTRGLEQLQTALAEELGIPLIHQQVEVIDG